MEVRYGDGTTDEDPGVDIGLTGDEVALAAETYTLIRPVTSLRTEDGFQGAAWHNTV